MLERRQFYVGQSNEIKSHIHNICVKHVTRLTLKWHTDAFGQMWRGVTGLYGLITLSTTPTSNTRKINSIAVPQTALF